jgi:dipeptidyl aminopeptidase/acylaminoacyl peptidase
MRKKWIVLPPLISLAFFPPAMAETAQKEASSSSAVSFGDSEAKRPLTSDDLVGLHDIGPMTSGPEPHAVTLSPDRKKISFLMQQAVPETNDYRLGIFVMDLRLGASPIRVDTGGELIRKTVTGVGGEIKNTGFPVTISPIWSKDGRAIYFLKRLGQSTQIWRAWANGSGSEQITHDDGDVVEFAIAKSGTRLTYAIQVIDPIVQAAQSAEALRGYRYDARFMPLFASGPNAFPSMQKTIVNIDLRSGERVSGSASDRQFLEVASRETVARDAATTSDGRPAKIIQDTDPILGKSTRLVAVAPNGRSYRCTVAACSGAETLWWNPEGKRVRYLRRESWGNSVTAAYEWRPGSARPEHLYSTEDALIDCQPIDDNLLCVRERSTVPRQIILLSPRTGHSDVLFDPNPNFGQFSLGKVERLHWRNAFGIETFGDIVYPVGYVPGRAYPLIVVQYISRGFLRGGVGDEFPIQVFANNGYAVLSVQRPSATRLVPEAKTRMELERQLLDGFKDRRSVLSSIEAGVNILTARGIADPGRIGITGLSDGSSTVQFAAINSKMFRAGSVSGCCWDPFQDAFMGPTVTAAFHQMGWPSLIENRSSFWDHMSLIGNAKSVSFPILMQQSDDEFRGAVPSFTALRQAGKSAALFVFPNEYHFKWQPAHRLAVYERNLRWFDFWLRDLGDGSEWKEDGKTPLPTITAR